MATAADQEINKQSQPDDVAKPAEGVSALTLFMSLFMGTYFGIVLTKSEVVRWQRVHDMFLFNEPHMYLIIGVGVVVAMISMLITPLAQSPLPPRRSKGQRLPLVSYLTHPCALTPINCKSR